MPRIKKKKTATILLAMVIAMAGAGLAFAYWTSGGSGSGTGATGSSQNVTINQTNNVSGMGPGVAAKPLSGTFNNPGPSTATVNTVTVSIESVTDGAGPGCSAADYVLTGAAMTVTGNPIAVGPVVGTWSGATIAFLNDPDNNQDDCQGATVNLDYVAS